LEFFRAVPAGHSLPSQKQLGYIAQMLKAQGQESRSMDGRILAAAAIKA
jgi:hypothetical protein